MSNLIAGPNDCGDLGKTLVACSTPECLLATAQAKKMLAVAEHRWREALAEVERLRAELEERS